MSAPHRGSSRANARVSGNAVRGKNRKGYLGPLSRATARSMVFPARGHAGPILGFELRLARRECINRLPLILTNALEKWRASRGRSSRRSRRAGNVWDYAKAIVKVTQERALGDLFLGNFLLVAAMILIRHVGLRCCRQAVPCPLQHTTSFTAWGGSRLPISSMNSGSQLRG